MQKNAHLVDLENAEKWIQVFSIYYQYLLAKIGVDTAENEPEIRIYNINDMCTPYFQPKHRHCAVAIRNQDVLRPQVLVHDALRMKGLEPSEESEDEAFRYFLRVPTYACPSSIYLTVQLLASFGGLVLGKEGSRRDR